MKRVIYDVDNTLTLNSSGTSYDQKSSSPLLSPADLDAIAPEEICYFTARNMLSLGEDLSKIQAEMVPVLRKWLAKNQLPDGPIYIGKPYCGEQGIYVDDRAVNLNGHRLSLTSGLINSKVCIVVALFNARSVVREIVLELIELSTMCPELKVVLVDNGSADGTGDFISQIADAYPFIDHVNLSSNIGYGGAIKAGISVAKSAFDDDQYSLIVSHGNSKFSILDFVKGVSRSESLADVCFTKRLNRSIMERAITRGLLILYRLVTGLSVPDCVGASRYVPYSALNSLNFDLAPEDYLFDMWLALHLHDHGFAMVPQVQMNHRQHKSSWSDAPFSKLKMSMRYLAYLREYLGRSA